MDFDTLKQHPDQESISDATVIFPIVFLTFCSAALQRFGSETSNAGGFSSRIAARLTIGRRPGEGLLAIFFRRRW